jgi:hypothetical protein
MMSDNDLEVLYKSALPESHFAGLRAVFDAGYADGSGASVEATDASLTAAVPPAADDPTITTA